MKTALTAAATVAALLATLAWASIAPSSVAPSAEVRTACLSEADVLLHQDRSRNGISPICSERVRRHNLREEASR